MAKNNEPQLVLGKGQSLADSTRNMEIAVPDSHRNGHLWCIGTTRVGKTRVIENMAEQDIRKGYSVVFIDPKGDLEIFSKIVQVAFEEGRQEELMLVTPIFPALSAILDPLAYYFMPEELVGHIVSGVEVGKEKFFYNVAYEISLVVVQAFIMLAKAGLRPPRFNLNDVKNVISIDDLKALQEKLVPLLETAEARQLSSDIQKILKSPPDYYGKVSSSLRVALMELTSGNIGKIIGRADENRFLKRLEEGKRVIMVVQLGSLLTRRASYTLGKVVISMIQSFVGRVFASGRKVTPPLCLYLDEAQNVLYYGIDDLFAKAGGAGVWVHGFSQDINQLYANLGRDYAKVILDNTNTKLFMRAPDAETAQYVADHFGEKTKFAPILSVGGGMTARSLEEPVLKPADILNMPARKFYLMGYGGSFVGKTADVSNPYIHIKLPDISGEGTEQQGQANV